jgi:O-antigen/teichoic acid export membrane protein
MGPEAYGLVGFFAMLQAWFSLLDMGLSGTLARESARFYGGAMDALQYRRLLRALEGIFLAIALVGGLSFYAASGYIATNWLKASSLPLSEVQIAVELMAAIIAVRWMGGIYRSAITGAERLVWLGAYSSVMTTLRFVGVLPILVFVDASPKAFFVYQFFVALIEFLGLVAHAYRLIPGRRGEEIISWSWAPVKPLIRFSMTIAVTSSIWILTTQTDKLLLSTLLPLTEYGYFTLAVLVASSVTLVSAPVSAAIMPRMARLEAERDHAGLIRVYRQTTQLVAVVAGATSLTLAFCATPLLWAWTGDLVLAENAAPILVLYAIGNGVLAVSAFPYYLQFAKGNLRLHLVGNIIFVLFMIPAIVVGTSKFGMIGAGYVWLGINCLSFVLWLPFVHQKFEPGLNKDWYLTDVLRIFASVGFAGFLLSTVNIETQSRFLQFLAIGGFGFLLIAVGAMASTAFWAFLRVKVARP